MNTVLDDILAVLKDMREFMRHSAQRSLGERQKKILLANKTADVNNLISSFVNEEGQGLQKKHNGINLIVAEINTVLITIPRAGEFEYLYLELASLTNFLRTVIVDITSELGKIEASANLLAQIVAGMNEFTELPTIPSRQNPEYIHEIKVSMTAILSIAKVYKSVIRLLPSMPINDLEVWASKSFWHFKLGLEYIDKIDIFNGYEIYKQKQKTPEFFENYAYAHSATADVAQLAYDLYLKLGDNWPVPLATYELLDDNISLESILKAYEDSYYESEDAIKRLEDAYNRRRFDFNDNPYVNQSIREFAIEVKSIDTQINNGQAFLDYVSFKDREVPPKSLDTAIITTKKLLTDFENLYSSREHILISKPVENYFHFVEEFLVLNAIKAVWLNQKDIFTDALQDFNFIFDKSDIYRSFNLIITKNLASLFIVTHFNNTNEFATIRDELIILKLSLEFRPQDYISTNVLIAILTMLIGDYETKKDIENILREAKEKGIFQRGQDQILNEYEIYAGALVDVLDGKSFAESYDPRHRRSTNVLDPKTWFIPDFRPASKFKFGLEFEYIPFNREDDKII